MVVHNQDIDRVQEEYLEIERSIGVVHALVDWLGSQAAPVKPEEFAQMIGRAKHEVVRIQSIVSHWPEFGVPVTDSSEAVRSIAARPELADRSEQGG